MKNILLTLLVVTLISACNNSREDEMKAAMDEAAKASARATDKYRQIGEEARKELEKSQKAAEKPLKK